MKAQKGLTLVELMVTVAVAVVLLGIGVPLFRGVVSNNALVAETNDLVTALNLARSEAVKRGAEVTVCAKGASDPLDEACGDNTTWTNGWQVFVDGGTRGTFESASDTRLRVWDAPPSGAALTASTGSFSFTQEGASTATAENTVQVAHSGSTNASARCVRVMVGGVIRTHLVSATQTCP